MDEAMMKMVIEAVLREIGNQGHQDSCEKEGYDKLLVVGDVNDAPSDLAEDYEVLPLEDYKHSKNIHRYQRILITNLTLTQLSDIAQGRDGSLEAGAVVEGLLNGLEVSMTEQALPHRKYAAKTSSRIYQVIENNVKTIQTFGIKILGGRKLIEPLPAKPPKYQAPKQEIPKGNALCNGERLVTEDGARAMTNAGEKEVCLAADAIITPLAWDLFHARGVHVIRKSI